MSGARKELASPEARLAQADQALLLARIVGSVAALACLGWAEISVFNLARMAMIAEVGLDMMPAITQLMYSARLVLVLGLPVLCLITLFFVWSRGRTAAWLAGLGLLLMILCAALAHLAMILPLLRITERLQA